jgi:hypothetical protein
MKQSRSETLCNEEIRRCGVVDNPENVRKAWLRWYGHVIRREEKRESWSDILWNEEIGRRCGVVDIAETVRKARLRWYGHVITRDEGEPIRDIME